jgi:putative membrane protein
MFVEENRHYPFPANGCARALAHAISLVLILAFVGCSRPQPSSPSGLSPLDDGQIAEITDAIDTQQIETARLAVAHASDPETRAFAQEMLGDDTAARRELLARLRREKAQLQPSVLINIFESRARAARAWLSNESGSTFDRDFLADEVEEQTRQLDWFDHILTPAARDGALRAELERQQASAAARLANAGKLSLRHPPTAPAPLQ